MNSTSEHLVPYGGLIRHLNSDGSHGFHIDTLSVTLEQIADQRSNGWPDFHPERFCHRCGNTNTTWHTAPEVWNPTMRPQGTRSPWHWNEIICIPCFIELTERRLSMPLAWRIERDEHGLEALKLRTLIRFVSCDAEDGHDLDDVIAEFDIQTDQ